MQYVPEIMRQKSGGVLSDLNKKKYFWRNLETCVILGLQILKIGKESSQIAYLDK
jgi:hypothetical protein